MLTGDWPLPIQLGGVMGDRKKHLQKLTVGNQRRIIGDANRFGMAGIPAADHFILCCLRVAPRIARSRPNHPFDMLKDSLNAPKAAARNDRRLLPFHGGERGVNDRIRNSHGSSGSVAAQCSDNPKDSEKEEPRRRHTPYLSEDSSVYYHINRVELARP